MKTTIIKSEAEVLVGCSSIWFEGEPINVPGVPARNYLRSETVSSEFESDTVARMVEDGLKVLRITRFV